MSISEVAEEKSSSGDDSHEPSSHVPVTGGGPLDALRQRIITTD